MSNRTDVSEQTLPIIACLYTKSIAVRFAAVKFAKSEYCTPNRFPCKLGIKKRGLLTVRYSLWVCCGRFARYWGEDVVPAVEDGPVAVSRGRREIWKPGMNIVPRCRKLSGVCLLSGTVETNGFTHRTLVSKARSWNQSLVALPSE